LVGSGNSSKNRLLDLWVMRPCGACITHLASLYCAVVSGRIRPERRAREALLFDKFIDEKGFAGGGLWLVFGAEAVSWILDLVVVGLAECGAICAGWADDDRI
jgi:hypothetical protein